MEIVYIGISGRAKHGKDTFAAMLEQEILVGLKGCVDFDTMRIAFADPIKKMVQIQFPQVTDDDLWGPSENREKIIQGYIHPETGEPLKIRDVLKHIGGWGRATNPNCWIEATFRSIENYFQEEQPKIGIAIISDVRYRNEKEFIESRVGEVYRIVRPSVGFSSNHPSETDLDDPNILFTDVITNNDNFDDFRAEAQIIAKRYMKLVDHLLEKV